MVERRDESVLVNLICYGTGRENRARTVVVNVLKEGRGWKETKGRRAGEAITAGRAGGGRMLGHEAEQALERAQKSPPRFIWPFSRRQPDAGRGGGGLNLPSYAHLARLPASFTSSSGAHTAHSCCCNPAPPSAPAALRSALRPCIPALADQDAFRNRNHSVGYATTSLIESAQPSATAAECEPFLLGQHPPRRLPSLRGPSRPKLLAKALAPSRRPLLEELPCLRPHKSVRDRALIHECAPAASFSACISSASLPLLLMAWPWKMIAFAARRQRPTSMHHECHHGADIKLTSTRKFHTALAHHRDMSNLRSPRQSTEQVSTSTRDE
ncbi:uncharacterized protein B0H18DRAFT_353237 [Fomitopsis serialis]|uniref:uncharacterized protein n=1 Tax=Fomitopsis serialis TaxID=139415 RepID=UPI0020087526|nr:uncharacterized protein B0H18DRAFT_353237 [Neoantrodia serialis]KAH9926194.1 hypothetical protein B0H18DRAFT_353237 [Neoantrodia serialis]